MANSSNDWYFTKEQLESTPSKQCGVEPYKELSYRQQAANFIQDMGQKLKVSQLCINTAIVYMHRFYVFHSFTRFPWNSIAAAALFLAAKVEEQPRKLEHVIRVVNICKNPHDTNFDTTSERYLAQSQDLVFNENILLQTLGFDVAIDHPHTHVVRCCHLVRASKDLAQTSYFMASNREWSEIARQLLKLPPEQSGSAKSLFLQAYLIATKSLHLTTMCLMYKPTVVACFCIHFVCKWSNWEIPLSNEKKEWFSYVDETVTSELLEQLTKEFLYIYDRCPSRLKEKIMAIGDGLALSHNSSHPSSPFEPDKKFGPFPSSDSKDPHVHRLNHGGDAKPVLDRLRLGHDPGSSGPHRDREREYREKKDRERMGHHVKPPLPNTPSSNKHPPVSQGHHSHAPPVDPKLVKHARPPSAAHPRVEPRDILREAAREIGLRDYKEPLTKEPVPSREVNQQQQQAVRAGDKREYMQQHQRQEVKAAVDTVNSAGVNFAGGGDKRVEPGRPRPVDPKLQARRREDAKPYNKLESDIKKHLSAAIHDKNSFLHKPVNSVAQKVKSPFAPETLKPVPNQSVTQASSTSATITARSEPKVEPHNGTNSNGSIFNLPVIENDLKVKFEASGHEALPPVVVPTKKPSLFSPEKSPPPQKKPKTKTLSSGKKSSEAPTVVAQPSLPPSGPGFELPTTKRSRTSSTNSEPELRPVMKKIDQVQGFENLMRDSSIGIKLHQVPDIITPIPDVKQEKLNVMQSSIAKELKPPDLIPPFMNGIETNPSLISSLLKETPSVPHLPVVGAVAVVPAEPPKEKEHHKEHKKNKKEKHKHKDKEKSREEKEKKKKHKDKDREKHKHKQKHEVAAGGAPLMAQPIKITIPKDKIQQPLAENPMPNLGLKIKIPKDRIKTDGIGESSTTGGGLKIKISKDVISNFNSDSSRKREREKSSPSGGPPHKISKSNHNRLSDGKHSRNSYSKVTQLGDGETSIHRLAESKYINKGATT